jgi:hypothetical protein
MKLNKSKYVILAAVVAALAVPWIGCGNGDGDSTQSANDEGGQLTKAEFIAQADPLCRKVDKKKQEDVDAFAQETGINEGKPLTPALEKRFIVEVAMPPIRAEAEELRAMAPPNEPEATAILNGLEKAIDASEENAKKGEAADTFARVSTQARKYGFKACILYY